MKIGLMLRTFHEKGGVGVYARYITRELLDLDASNEYYLYYMGTDHLGTHVERPNVTERAIQARSKAIWDQVKVPAACKKDGIDVLFHPKFTVPLFAPCRTVMTLHGAGWFIPEHREFWSRADRAYLNVVMPLYCRQASAILSVSDVTTDVFNRRFNLPAGKVRTVYFAPGRQFRRIDDTGRLQATRRKYDLPERFILTLSKYPGGDRKNIDGILEAYRLMHGQTDCKLVVAGKDCFHFRTDYGIPADGYGADIIFPGYVDQMDLPSIYSMADVFLYPSKMEAFPVPITEALACGTPIVTSTLNGLREIAADAALAVDAFDPKDIAAGVLRVLSDDHLRTGLAERALERSRHFSWDKCARETLNVLENL